MEATGMPGHLIRRMQQMASQIFVAHMRDAGHDITSVQFAAMDALRECPGIDQARVATMIAYDRVTIGGVIERLVRKGLVQRTVSQADRRARVLILTEAGEKLFAEILPIVRAVQVEILAPLSSEEGRMFKLLLGKLLETEDRGVSTPE
jgi:MarR family transcriptional regulator, temperature-dependent positive regulator of motility